MRNGIATAVLTCLTIASAIVAASGQDNPAASKEQNLERTHAPAASEFLVLPLHVYRAKSADVAEIDCRQLSDDDIRRIVTKANVIWASAGIHWQLESIEDVQAENTGRVKLAALIDADDDEAPGKKPAKNARLPHAAFRRVIPESTRKDTNVFRVHYIHDFDVNGVYFGNREAMVKETAALRKVESGIDEPLPRVTSHELGHALGLPHRQDTLNLMASGTTGTFLNEDEMRKAREIARANPACRTVDSLEKEGKSSGEDRKAMISRTLRSVRALAGKRIHPVLDFDFAAFERAILPEPARP